MSLNQKQNNKLIKGTFFYSIRQLFVTIIQFVSSVLILKWLDPVNYGTYSIIALVIGLTQIIADGGFSVYLIQRQGDINNNDLSEIISFQFLIYFILHSILFFIFLFFIRDANQISFFIYLLVTFFVIPITILRSSHYIWLEKSLLFDKIAIVEIFETIIYSATLLLLAFYKFGVWSFVIASILKAITGLLIIRIFQKWNYKFSFPKITNSIKKSLNFGLSYHTPAIINYIRISANPLIIGPILGLSAVGIADRAIFFAGLPLYFIGAIQQKVLFPYFSSIQSSMEKVKTNFESIYYFSSIVDKIIYLPLIILAPYLIHIYYPLWLDTLPLFYIALIGNIIFGSLSFSTFPVLNGIGKTNVIAISSVISVLISWVFIFPLINFFGLKGYAILSLLIWIIGFIPGYYLIKKHIHQVTIFKQSFLPLLSFSVSLLIINYLKFHFEENLFNLSILSFFSILLYIIFIFILDKKIIIELSNKFLLPLLKI
jgi:O-antigen/teichoic acid export membrane protein